MVNNLSTNIEYNGTKCKIYFTLKPLLNLKLLNLAQTSIKVQLNKRDENNYGYLPLKNINNIKNYKYPKTTNINKILNSKKSMSRNSYKKVIDHILKTLIIMMKNYIQKERIFLSNTNLLNDNILKKRQFTIIKNKTYKFLNNLSNKSYIDDKKIKNIKSILKNYVNEFKQRFKNKHTSDSPFILILSLKNKLNKIT